MRKTDGKMMRGTKRNKEMERQNTTKARERKQHANRDSANDTKDKDRRVRGGGRGGHYVIS